MIKAYVSGITSLYEGEDIEIRYAIFEDENLLSKEFVVTSYKKPAIVGAIALLRLLKALEPFISKEITIVLNEAALCEFIKGTGNTKNKDIQRLVREIRNELTKFESVVLNDVGVNFKELEKWNDVLRGE